MSTPLTLVYMSTPPTVVYISPCQAHTHQHVRTRVSRHSRCFKRHIRHTIMSECAYHVTNITALMKHLETQHQAHHHVRTRVQRHSTIRSIKRHIRHTIMSECAYHVTVPHKNTLFCQIMHITSQHQTHLQTQTHIRTCVPRHSTFITP